MSHSAPLLYPYQRRYLADASRFKAGMWSRQTGKTFTTTLEAVLDVLEAEAKPDDPVLGQPAPALPDAAAQAAHRRMQSVHAVQEEPDPDYGDTITVTVHESRKKPRTGPGRAIFTKSRLNGLQAIFSGRTAQHITQAKKIDSAAQ